MSARKIRVEGDIAYVPLTQGKEAIIDAADVHLVEGFNWFANKGRYTFYAVRNKPTVNGKAMGLLRMHRVIVNAPGDMQVDHINGDGLNNRRNNMRLATHAENKRNTSRQTNNSSGFKGVTWNKWRGKWQSQIKAGGEYTYLGYFDCPKEAHAAYCAASEKYHGDFGRTD